MAITGQPKIFYAVVIGAGLAGLTLSRQLLLYSDKSILLIDKRHRPPREAPQKVPQGSVAAWRGLLFPGTRPGRLYYGAASGSF